VDYLTNNLLYNPVGNMI